MSERPSRRRFAARPGDTERWIKTAETAPRDGEEAGFTARLTIDVTPELRGRIKIAAFRRGITVADMLRAMLTREFPSNQRRPVMTGAAVTRAHGGPMPPAHLFDDLTHVELTHVEKRIEHWVRFGRAARERVIDRRRRVVSYRPDAVFAFVRWAANDFGTVISRIDIVRAVSPGDSYQTLPFVRPGGDILLKVEGWPKVERVLRQIDAVEAAGINAADVAPDHWRHVANRMSAGQEPRPYTLERHQAWLKRREVSPDPQQGPDASVKRSEARTR